MNRLAITAEGPSSDIMNQRENPTGHTYLAPHEPARFIPFDPEITARALESAAWYGRFASFLSNKARKHEAQRDELREQLKTRDAEIAELRNTARDWQKQFHSAEADAERYRTALEGMKWNTDPIIRAHVLKALAKEDAEQEGEKNG